MEQVNHYDKIIENCKFIIESSKKFSLSLIDETIEDHSNYDIYSLMKYIHHDALLKAKAKSQQSMS